MASYAPPVRSGVSDGKILIQLLSHDPVQGMFHGVKIGLEVLVIVIAETVEERRDASLVLFMVLEALSLIHI